MKKGGGAAARIDDAFGARHKNEPGGKGETRYNRRQAMEGSGMALMTVFHGSGSQVERPEIRIGRYTKDFGPGFYCTILREQAERWARRFDTPRVNTYTVRLLDGLDILEFPDMTEEWLDFIIACRHGEPHNHDVVIGAMANDQIYNFVSDYMDGAITREQFWALAKFKYPTHQICLCSDRALKCLNFVHCEEV